MAREEETRPGPDDEVAGTQTLPAADDPLGASEPAGPPASTTGEEPPGGPDRVDSEELPEPEASSGLAEFPEAAGVPPPPLPAPSERPLELRLASIHLRTGVLALARAELETSAGRGELDDAALLDLAEVRWRTDDVTGAGEAAAAYFATGREDTLALVIATEATASIGRSTEARRLAARALARGDVPIDEIFRGIRPSSYWPATSAMTGEPAGTLFGGPRHGSSAGTAGVTGAAVLGRLAAAEEVGSGLPSATDPGRPPPGPAHEPAAAGAATIGAAMSPTLWSDEETMSAGLSAGLATGLSGASLPDPAAELDAARADLADDRGPAAAIRLAVVLRIAPDQAAAVLEVLSGISGPSIELVRGDALRLSGHEAEARQAYARAAGLLGGGPPP
jgi:hypothetical protein